MNKGKTPITFATIVLLFFYVMSLVFWIDKFDWETASYITVFYGVIGVFFSLWQANAQKAAQKKDIVILELSLSEEIANNSMLQYSIDEIDGNSPETLHQLRECMHLINKISLFTRKELINFEELYLICGNDLKGVVLRCIKVIADFDYEIEFISKDYILRYRDGLIDLYNRISKIDDDILLVQDKVDHLLKLNPNRLTVKSI
ncbi:hypothetical protein FRZ06_21070 [Anoxybacterium hadale]|uniref:Uncharacterized protein n=1 Tax=Anoxybacterium hadale TaxID=3408580 RepID=A0ACD1AGV6_9FIRM|nr:hypothetical protein FRZ06_21070 [Clostridiales bacterium]